jgi:hypothetical protein
MYPTNQMVCIQGLRVSKPINGVPDMAATTLGLSIGEAIPDRRLSENAHSGTMQLKGKRVRVDISESAVEALSDRETPLLIELELYFSCLVRKQIRFTELPGKPSTDSECTRVIRGLYASFRAVTTSHCRIDETDGKPPVETMPVKKADLFVPDWLKLDFRTGRWLGEYGFKNNF